MPVDFNPEYFNELSRSHGVRALVDSVTARVAAAARSSAPVVTGEYRRGIRATGKLQRRYVGLVIASAPHSLLVESKYGTLARALRANVKGRSR